jgi:hypothetical protein
MNDTINQLKCITDDMHTMLCNLRDDLTYDDPRELTDRLLEISTAAEAACNTANGLVNTALCRRAKARMQRDAEAKREPPWVLDEPGWCGPGVREYQGANWVWNDKLMRWEPCKETKE